MKNFAVNLGLMLLGTLLFVAGAEIYFRVNYNSDEPIIKSALQAAKIPSSKSDFQTHPVVGYRPILNSNVFNKNGIHVSSGNISGQSTAKRILFIGDSVTSRGKIIEALKDLYNPSNYTFLNAGVEGYNVIQEVDFYEGFNQRENPALVILTLHNNDLNYIPVIYQSRDSGLLCWIFGETQIYIHPNLLEWSYFYRFLLLTRINNMTKNAKVKDLLLPNTFQALLRLRDKLIKQQVPLRVILFPVLKPLSKWSQEEIISRRNALKIVDELKVQYVDLFPALENYLHATQSSVETIQELKGDNWHPNEIGAKVFAQYLYDRKFLELQ